jgi:hypothetical protein
MWRKLLDYAVWLLVTVLVFALIPLLAIVYLIDRLLEKHHD